MYSSATWEIVVGNRRKTVNTVFFTRRIEHKRLRTISMNSNRSKTKPRWINNKKTKF